MRKSVGLYFPLPIGYHWRMKQREESPQKNGIGSVLADLIREKKTNVNEVAVACGIKPTTLYSIIKRDSMSVNIRDLARVARYLGVTLNYFYDRFVEAQSSARQVDAGVVEGSSMLAREPDGEEIRHDTNIPMMSEDSDSGANASGCLALHGTQVRDVVHSLDFYVLTDDSMAPTCARGDVVAVASAKPVEIGDIGAFATDGKIIIRKLGYDALIPVNVQYSVRTGLRGIECLGKVVGWIQG